eukprot:TRINITY_DN4620_c0_g1_i2.p1 TRINITY_DN4620_c0_g1~~TRINITY_DN4620_c0_g1_i2.p1  ORF type:complete len:244 (-),score=19.85 TRINITY_DN4620_c0_g1_i2:544-1275(-)
MIWLIFFFFQAEDGIRDAQESRGLGDVYKRQVSTQSTGPTTSPMPHKPCGCIRCNPQRGKQLHQQYSQSVVNSILNPPPCHHVILGSRVCQQAGGCNTVLLPRPRTAPSKRPVHLRAASSLPYRRIQPYETTGSNYGAFYKTLGLDCAPLPAMSKRQPRSGSRPPEPQPSLGQDASPGEGRARTARKGFAHKLCRTKFSPAVLVDPIGNMYPDTGYNWHCESPACRQVVPEETRPGWRRPKPW